MSMIDGMFLMDALDGTALHPLSSATTMFNVFQAFGVDRIRSTDGEYQDRMLSIVVDLLLAAFAMAAARHFYRFMTETWPTWVLAFVKSLWCLHEPREAAALDVLAYQPEEFVFDNELLLLAIEGYVAHLLRHVEDSQHDGSTAAKKDDNSRGALRQRSQLLRKADCRLTPITMPHYKDEKDMVSFLRHCCHFMIVPMDGQTVEVEEGLTVCFMQQLVSNSALSVPKFIPRRGRHPSVSRLPPINFDTKPPERSGAEASCVRGVHDECLKGGSGEKNEDEEEHGEEEDGEDSQLRGVVPFSSPSKREGLKKVPVRQAVFCCTDSKDGKERILEFVRRAYKWYVHLVMEPTKRYYFYLSDSELNQAIYGPANRLYDMSRHFRLRRYLFSSQRNSFSSLFFPQKLQLLSLLDEFKNKQGRFAVSGVPHQLVILLHGPPGTGKTSTARSVATYLDRHMLAVPIQYVQTNSGLLEILSGGSVLLDAGCEDCMNNELDTDFFSSILDINEDRQRFDLPTEQVVYMFDDIDVVSHMISLQLSATQRNLLQKMSENHDESKTTFKPASQTQHLLAPAADDGESDTGVKRRGGGLQHDSKSENSEYDDDVSKATRKKNWKGKSDREVEVEETTIRDVGSRLEALHSYQKLLVRDSLSPEGMLHALDGIFAPPGRVVIFTTNHPEQLPSFFWNPGLLTLSVHMGDLNAATAMELVEHYCHDMLTPELRNRFMAFFLRSETEKLTSAMNPASLKHMLLLYDDAEEMLQQLESGCCP